MKKIIFPACMFMAFISNSQGQPFLNGKNARQGIAKKIMKSQGIEPVEKVEIVVSKIMIYNLIKEEVARQVDTLFTVTFNKTSCIFPDTTYIINKKFKPAYIDNFELNTNIMDSGFTFITSGDFSKALSIIKDGNMLNVMDMIDPKYRYIYTIEDIVINGKKK